MDELVHLDELAMVAKCRMHKDHMLVYVKVIKELKKVLFDLTEVSNKRGAFIEELEKVKCLADIVRNVLFLNDNQRRDVEKAACLLIMIKQL
ncbi:hypothetical protein Tco_1135222 [Tanacetum coccineum]